MKNTIIYGLLTNIFEKNHEGFAHIGTVDPGDGFTAWNNLLNYVGTEIIESSGASKSDKFHYCPDCRKSGIRYCTVRQSFRSNDGSENYRCC